MKDASIIVSRLTQLHKVAASERGIPEEQFNPDGSKGSVQGHTHLALSRGKKKGKRRRRREEEVEEGWSAARK